MRLTRRAAGAMSVTLFVEDEDEDEDDD